MTTKMKGLLKGLRYISQIFESADEEEPEMQIGYPTDVKHVAHIGWDGPSVTSSPSWMNEFKSTPEFSSGPSSSNNDAKQNPGSKWPSEDSSSNARTKGSSLDLPDLPKASKHHQENTSINSPSREPSIDSSSTDSSYISKQSRKKKSKVSSSGAGGSTKGSSRGGSTKDRGGSTRSRSKEQNSSIYAFQFSDQGSKNDPTSALTTLQIEGNRGDGFF